MSLKFVVKIGSSYYSDGGLTDRLNARQFDGMLPLLFSGIKKHYPEAEIRWLGLEGQEAHYWSEYDLPEGSGFQFGDYFIPLDGGGKVLVGKPDKVIPLVATGVVWRTGDRFKTDIISEHGTVCDLSEYGYFETKILAAPQNADLRGMAESWHFRPVSVFHVLMRQAPVVYEAPEYIIFGKDHAGFAKGVIYSITKGTRSDLFWSTSSKLDVSFITNERGDTFTLGKELLNGFDRIAI